MRTLEQNKKLHVVLAQLGLNDRETKQELASQYSRGRTERTSELTEAEFGQMLSNLCKQPTDWQRTPENKARRRVLCLAHQLEWETDNGDVDMAVLDAWLTSPRSKVKKSLNDQTLAELGTTIFQLEQILLKDYAK